MPCLSLPERSRFGLSGLAIITRFVFCGRLSRWRAAATLSGIQSILGRCSVRGCRRGTPPAASSRPPDWRRRHGNRVLLARFRIGDRPGPGTRRRRCRAREFGNAGRVDLPGDCPAIAAEAEPITKVTFVDPVKGAVDHGFRPVRRRAALISLRRSSTQMRYSPDVGGLGSPGKPREHQRGRSCVAAELAELVCRPGRGPSSHRACWSPERRRKLRKISRWEPDWEKA